MATDKKNGSQKWENAVDKARGANDGESDNALSNVSVGGSEAMIGKVSAEDLASMAASGEWEFAPQLKTLEVGDMIAGVLEGYGPGTEFENKVTGEIRAVNTWIIASPDGKQRASILSSAQLDRKLPPFIGGSVRIIRGNDMKTSNGFRVTDYIVAGKSAPGVAATRKWGSDKPYATLDGQRYSDSKALPAGSDVPPPGDDVNASAPASA